MQIRGAEIFVKSIEGSGEYNFVLIHNAGSDHRFFTHQVDLLKRFGNVHLFDLPGSGESQTLAPYKMSDLANLVEEICFQLSLSSLCLIGLNNGANIAIESTLRKKIMPTLLVLIDPPIFLEPSFISEIKGFIEVIEKGEFDEKFVEGLVQDLFFKTSEENRTIARSAFNRVDKGSLKQIFEGIIDWDQNSKFDLKSISAPCLCILTDEHHCSFEKMKQHAPHFEIGKVMGSKCWATLEVSDQINSMIARFLKLYCW